MRRGRPCTWIGFNDYALLDHIIPSLRFSSTNPPFLGTMKPCRPWHDDPTRVLRMCCQCCLPPGGREEGGDRPVRETGIMPRWDGPTELEKLQKAAWSELHLICCLGRRGRGPASRLFF